MTIITDDALRAMPKVGPNEAAKYIGNGICAQYIRFWCQDGNCPFGHAQKRSGSRRTAYHINVERLIKYKHGDISLHEQQPDKEPA